MIDAIWPEKVTFSAARSGRLADSSSPQMTIARSIRPLASREEGLFVFFVALRRVPPLASAGMARLAAVHQLLSRQELPLPYRLATAKYNPQMAHLSHDHRPGERR